jgi:hypothetical protein
MPSESLSLALESIFLALSKGDRHSIRIYFLEGPSRGHRPRASAKPSKQYYVKVPVVLFKNTRLHQNKKKERPILAPPF